MNILKCLKTDGVTILRECQPQERDLEKVYESGLPLLLDNPHENIYFVKFADEMPQIRILFGDFHCFGKISLEKMYFVIDKEERIFVYDFNDSENITLTFVNSSLWDFVYSYLRYMAGIFMYKAHKDKKDFPLEDEVERISEFIQKLDPTALEKEENYWPHQLYVLEDGFAHFGHNVVSRNVGLPMHNYEKKD